MVYKQLMSVKKGKYTPEEEERLISAIRQVLGLDNCPVNELPALGIKWQAVAQIMNNERNSVEYQIKWGHLRQKLLFGRNPSINEEDQIQSGLRILEAISAQLAEDAVEVNWNEVSRRCCIGPGHAGALNE